MYLSNNINSKQDILQKVCKKDNKSASLLAIYKAQLVRVRTRQSPWQICSGWLSSKVNMLWVKYLKSLQNLLCTWYFLRHGGEITCEITGRWRRSDVCDVGGKGLEVPCFLVESQETAWRRLQTARTSCLPFNRLARYPFPGIVSNHNSHRRLLKMPLVVVVVVVVVSIS